MLKVAAILEESIVDGPGIRSVIFFRAARGIAKAAIILICYLLREVRSNSPQQLADEVFPKLTPLHRGITLSGGDPLAQADDILEFLKLVRRENPKLTIWCYTGYWYDEVKDSPVLQEIDVLVDGPFILAQRNLDLPFRGFR